MFYDHKKKEILDFIKECYQLTFDTTKFSITNIQKVVEKIVEHMIKQYAYSLLFK